MEKREFIAHAARDENGKWRAPHDLADHLRDVGELASEFAEQFGADWARLAGRWHDLGKYRPRFQNYIRQVSGFEFEADAHIKGEAGKAPHSTAGALLAIERFGIAGRVLAYLIAGHHAGLADWFGSLDS
ncbi:MAG: CRISPR-associated endonuclease Cas3'', partial [Xanthomonadales bacterium]|nr:CRISPR-associated endonuclease Cas3'' [Xanthomonadales bacterium]